MLLLAAPAVLQRCRISRRLSVGDKRRNVMSRDGGSGYKMYVFKESIRCCIIDYKGRGRKEVIYLYIANVSCM